ncbi:phage major capsid protein, partial [Streptococcus gordonii]|nr:phage major capsid protein [Streptococcus gordonii]
MTDQLSRGTLFDPMLVTDLINNVKGHSSLAKLSNQ